jgi:hypothetical protein
MSPEKELTNQEVMDLLRFNDGDIKEIFGSNPPSEWEWGDLRRWVQEKLEKEGEEYVRTRMLGGKIFLHDWAFMLDRGNSSWESPSFRGYGIKKNEGG